MFMIAKNDLFITANSSTSDQKPLLISMPEAWNTLGINNLIEQFTWEKGKVFGCEESIQMMLAKSNILFHNG